MFFIGAVVMTAGLAFGECCIKNGDTLAFLGDSITQFGQNDQDGYVNLVIRGLEAEGIEVTPVKAGISGNKSNQMLERLDRDVLSKKPQWMTLSCGINDVWHQELPNHQGVLIEDYKKNITAILDKCAAAGCEVIVLTTTIYERDDPAGGKNAKVVEYNDFLRKIAAERKLRLVDLNAAFWNAKQADRRLRLTRDGVHMQSSGNHLMAKTILEGVGVPSGDFAKIEREAWAPVWVLCRFELKDAADRKAFVKATNEIIGAVRHEAGCLEYSLVGDAETDWERPERLGDKTLWMIERWASVTSLKRHLETPHMKKYGPKVAPFKASSTFNVLQPVTERQTK